MGLPLALPVLLLIFWLILAGRIDLQYVILGLLFAVGTTAFTQRLFPRDGRHAARSTPSSLAGLLRVIPIAASYVVALLVDLVWANLRVAYIVLNPRLPINPVFYEYEPPVRATWARVLLANSVTLTPGTLSVELTERSFLVHALTPESGRSLVEWSAEKRIRRIEELLGGGSPS